MHRDPANPILTRAEIPAVTPDLVDVTSVFNPGAIRVEGRDRLLLRVQTRGRDTVLMVADEDRDAPGRFSVRDAVVSIDGLDADRRGISHVYDPRLTALDDVVYMLFAADTPNGCRLGVARAVDPVLTRFELVGLDETGDRRNGVLFPARVGGRFARLERPNRVAPAGGPPTGDSVELAVSDDLIAWKTVGPVMTGRPYRWDERVGSGPPPVRVADGWLHVYHGVATHFASCNIYQAGVVLLDGDDPTIVRGRSRLNVLEPRETYELVGQVPNVVFPSGMTVETENGIASREAAVRIYYGAADTCVAMARTTVGDLLDAALAQPAG